MNQPTLFARTTDPETSHAAADAAAPGNAELVKQIRVFVAWMSRPVTAFEIADFVAGDRWDEGSVRTAVSRAGLTPAGEGVSPRGRRCLAYTL